MTVITTERPAAVAQQQAGSLAIRADQTVWTEQQAAVLRQSGISDDVTNAELASFLHLCQRTGLDPFSRQIYLIGRYDKRKQRTVYTPQTGIDGYRVIAQRVTGQTGGAYGYEDTLWCDSAGRWRDVWLADEPPAAAKVTVIRNGARFSAVARFSEYAETWPDGNLKSMWAKMPAGQIAKCCEALALRKAFPHDLAGVYTAEEMAQADNPEPAPRFQRQQPQQADAWQQATPAPAAAEQQPEPAPEPQRADDDLSPQARGLLTDAEAAQTPELFERVRQQAARAGAPAAFLARLDGIAGAKFPPQAADAEPDPRGEPAPGTLPGAPDAQPDRLAAIAALYAAGEAAGMSQVETRQVLAQETGHTVADATAAELARVGADLRAAGGAR